MGPGHLTMIVLHTVSALAAFGLGLVAVRPRRAREHGWLLGALVGALAAMVVFMVAAMVSHWDELDGAARVVFCALAVLGAYMVYRAAHARVVVAADDRRRLGRYVDDLGFVLISLFDGFVVVTSIDLGAPPWAVAAIAVAAVLVGHRRIATVKRELALPVG